MSRRRWLAFLKAIIDGTRPQPNVAIVSIADRLLARDGRMVRAIETIGPGDMAMEGRPFRLDIA
jgi:predicted protein tyrosine phosphatase